MGQEISVECRAVPSRETRQTGYLRPEPVCVCGDLEFLRTGNNINKQNKESGQTPLYASLIGSCTCKRRDDCVSLLLDLGADPNKRSKDARLPLSIAARFDGTGVCVEKLLAAGAKVNGYDLESGDTALIHAAKVGHQKCAEILIQWGADPNKVDKDNGTPLTYALEHPAIVQLLLEKGAQVDCRNTDGSTPLLACEKGHLEAAQLLVSGGADVNAQAEDGCSCFYMACQNGHVEEAMLLITNGADIQLVCTSTGVPPITACLHTGCLELVNILLQKNVDVTRANYNGYTALMIASKKGQVDCVRTLLHSGAAAGVNQASKSGATALHLSIGGGLFCFVPPGNFLEISKMLLSCGADVNARMDNEENGVRGISCLFRACTKNNIQHVRLFLDHGADLTLATEAGQTPLFVAAQYGHKEICEMLLDKMVANGIHVDQTSGVGVTPLFIAIERGHVNVARMLLDRGANVNVTCVDGTTPLLMACLTKNVAAINLLLDHGAEAKKVLRDIKHRVLVKAAKVPEDILELLRKKEAEQAKQDNRGEGCSEEPTAAAPAKPKASPPASPPAASATKAPPAAAGATTRAEIEASASVAEFIARNAATPPEAIVAAVEAASCRSCLACGSSRPGLKACSGCMSSWFCNQACQKSAWPQHKAMCKQVQKQGRAGNE